MQDVKTVLSDVAAVSGGTLFTEKRRRVVAPMPIRTDAGEFVNRTCPRCGGETFAHEYGDETCLCAGCGADLDVDELLA